MVDKQMEKPKNKREKPSGWQVAISVTAAFSATGLLLLYLLVEEEKMHGATPEHILQITLLTLTVASAIASAVVASRIKNKGN